MFEQAHGVHFHHNAHILHFFQIIRPVTNHVVIQQVIVPVVISVVRTDFEQAVIDIQFFPRSGLLQDEAELIGILYQGDRFRLFLSAGKADGLYPAIPKRVQGFIVHQ